LLQKFSLPPRGAAVGSALGRLRPEAAGELGLTPHCIVAAGVIDAHAGCMAPLATTAKEELDRSYAMLRE
jgi:ribulose kinase